MYNKVFKKSQINVGLPYEVRTPFNLNKPIVQNNVTEKKEPTHTQENILEEAKHEAEMIIKEAELEAEKIMSKAQEEAEVGIQQIEEEARKKGYLEGCDSAKNQYENLIQEAEMMKQRAEEQCNMLMESIEEDVIKMVIEISKKVIHSEVKLNKKNMLYIVKQAMDKCSNKEEITLKVSSEDYEYITENKEKLLQMVKGIGELEIKPISSMEVGDCIVETEYGSIDAGVDTKIKNIQEAFKIIIDDKNNS